MRREVVKVPAVTEQSFCTSCGASVDGMRFCTNCGTPVRGAHEAPASGAPEPVTPPVQPLSVEPPAERTAAPEPPSRSAAGYWSKPGPATPPAAPVTPPRGVGLTKPPSTPPADPPAAPPSQMPPAWSAVPPGAPPAAYPPQGRGPARDRRLVLWALIGLAAVLIVGGGAFALGTVATKSGHSSTAGTVAATPPASEEAAEDTGDASPGEQSPATPTDRGGAVAASLSTLITDSAKDKAAVGAAAAYLDSCRQVKASIRTLDKAAGSRNDLVARAGKVDTSGVPGADDVVANLTQAWRKSAKADSAFADYGRSLHRNAKGKCVGNKSWRARAVRLSAQSHPPKQAAAKAWNKLAKKYDLGTVEWGQL